MIRRRPLLFVMLSSLWLPARALPAERAWTDVTVRVYDAAPVADADRVRALAIAATVLAPAEIEMHFVHCSTAVAEPACGETLGADELALRLVRGSTPLLPAAGLQPLGDALVDTRRRKGALATIYVERVQWLARESHADPTVLLGRAIAHELVHALSGQSAHAPRGLMRAIWSSREVANDRAEDWRLQESEKSLLRNRRANLQAAAR
jgi:hypothetical protein